MATTPGVRGDREVGRTKGAVPWLGRKKSDGRSRLWLGAESKQAGLEIWERIHVCYVQSLQLLPRVLESDQVERKLLSPLD